MELLDTNEFRSATALEHHRKNVQLGLRIGQAALIEFEQHGQFMKAIWILMNNKLPSQKGRSDPLNRNPFWKFVVPTVSYFAWLLESLVRAFCAESLDTSPTRLYADPVQCLADLEGYEGPDFGMEVSHRGGSKGIMEVLQRGMRISGVEFNKRASPLRTEINENVSPCSRTGCSRKRGYVL